MDTLVKFSGLYDSAHAIVTSLCNPALKSRQARNGDEVIVAGIGCDVFFPALHYRSIVPVFVDVNIDTLLPDLDVIENCIVEGKTKAVIYPYTLGARPDQVKLRDICDEYGVFLVEIDGSNAELVGDLSLVCDKDSFYVRVCCNPVLLSSIKDFQLSIQQEKMKAINSDTKNLHSDLSEYRKYFRFQQSEDVLGGFSVLVKETSPFDKQEVQDYLKKKGIETVSINSGTLLKQPSFKSVRHIIFQDLVNSDVIMRDAFWIPLGQIKNKERIVKVFNEFIESKTNA